MPKLGNPFEPPERLLVFVLRPSLLKKKIRKRLSLLDCFYFLFMLKNNPQVLGRKKGRREEGERREEEKEEEGGEDEGEGRR